MHVARQKSRSDAEFYQAEKQAEANSLLLTPQYLELKRAESVANNAKLYFGPDLPHMFWPTEQQQAQSQPPGTASMDHVNKVPSSSVRREG
jgi:hypothetical protein